MHEWIKYIMVKKKEWITYIGRNNPHIELNIDDGDVRKDKRCGFSLASSDYQRKLCMAKPCPTFPPFLLPLLLL